MEAEDLAAMMLLCPEMLDDDTILMLLVADTETKEPMHLKYERFNKNSLSDDEFKLMFRFKKEHIGPLREMLQLRQRYKSATNITWTGEEGLCILLRRLAYPNRLCELVSLFGRHQTELSVIINVMLHEIFTKHNNRVRDIKQDWIMHEDFAKAIHSKGAALQNCWGFLDGTQGRMCRPQEGQQSVFNGHKRIHSLKYQALTCPNGLIAHFYGPMEGRRHDSALYYESGLDDELPLIQDANGDQLCIYGDSAYALRRYLITPFKGAKLSQIQHDFNKNMASVRVSVEWAFAKITQIFAFLAYHHNHKVFLQPIAKYWIVSAILCNCHTCLYGSQTGKYFDVMPPDIEEYLR